MCEVKIATFLFLFAHFILVVNGWAPQTQHIRHCGAATNYVFSRNIHHSQACRNRYPSTIELRNALKSDQDVETLAAASSALEKTFGSLWFDNPEACAQARNDFPDLSSYSDTELKDALVVDSTSAEEGKPRNIVDVFLKTPLGPVILINVIAWQTNFSWCDTPFGAEGACPPL